MLDLLKEPDFFTADNQQIFKIEPYRLEPTTLSQHLLILQEPSSKMTEYGSTQTPCLNSLELWVRDTFQDNNVQLLAIKDADSGNLVGTSKITKLNDEQFASGIFISSRFTGIANIGKFVKGHTYTKCFFSMGFSTCTGGCYTENFASMSIYRYFGFSAERESDRVIKFKLSKADYMKKLRSLLSPHFKESGFIIDEINDQEFFFSEISSLQGFSSLSFFNLISILLNAKKNLDVIDLYECTNIAEIVLALGPSLFSL